MKKFWLNYPFKRHYPFIKGIPVYSIRWKRHDEVWGLFKICEKIILKKKNNNHSLICVLFELSLRAQTCMLPHYKNLKCTSCLIPLNSLRFFWLVISYLCGKGNIYFSVKVECIWIYLSPLFSFMLFSLLLFHNPLL